jgi:D-threo-aldose 1-dehydrogenase
VCGEPARLKLPRLGLGAAPLGNLYTATSDDDARELLRVATALDDAYIDTAPYYGHGLSERRIGQFLALRPERNPLISTKVGRRLEPCANPPDHGFVNPAPFRPVFDYSARGIESEFEQSQKRLARSSVDLLLLHDIGRVTHGTNHDAIMAQIESEAWPALLALREAGQTAAIGLGVNECEAILEFIARGMIPNAVLLAGRHTLLDASAERSGVFELCSRHGVTIIAAAPFNSGLLAGGDHFDYLAAPKPLLAARKRLAAACKKFDTPLPAAALQFPLRNPLVTTVLAGARSASEFLQQLRWMTLQIPEELWRALEDIRREVTQ